MTTEPLAVAVGDGGSTSGLPTVTVVIPAHNEAEHIERCVRSCWDQTHRPEAVVVVADSCTDATAAIAAAAGATVVETDFRLKAANINHVLPAVTADVVAVIDADSYYSPSSLEHFARTIAGGVDATCAALFPMPSQRTSMIVAYRRFLYAVDKRWGRPIQQSIGRFYVLAGPASAFRVSALRAVGGYPERKGEDAFLTWELYRQGYTLGFTGKATVYTLEPTTWRSYFKQTDRWHSDFCQLTAAYWREYRKPRVLLVSGGAIWDTVTYPLVMGYALVSLIVNGWSGVGIPVLMWWVLLAMMVAQTAVAAKGLGVRRALAYLPAFLALGHVDILQKFWIIVREWVFGRHATTWTGRQGRKAVMTPMPAGRRRLFTGAPVLVGVYAVLALGTTATVMEATGVLPPRVPDRVQDALDHVPVIGGGDRPQVGKAGGVGPALRVQPAEADPKPPPGDRPGAPAPQPPGGPSGPTAPGDDPADPPSGPPSDPPGDPPSDPPADPPSDPPGDPGPPADPHPPADPGPSPTSHPDPAHPADPGTVT